MADFDPQTCFGDTLNDGAVTLLDNNDDDFVDVINDNDAETLVKNELCESSNSSSSDSGSSENASKSKSEDAIQIDPETKLWSKLYIETSEMYFTLKKSGDLPKGLPEPTMDTTLGLLQKLNAVLTCKYGRVTKSNGIAEEMLMAVCNVGAGYFNGEGDEESLNPNLSSLPDDMSLKIERDPSLKTALKEVSIKFGNPYVKIASSLALSALTLGMTSVRHKRDRESRLRSAMFNADYR